MKKKILRILIAITLLCSLSACSSESKKEFTADEFGKLQAETDKLFEEKSEYLTAEEKNGEIGQELYADCSDETGLPFNKEITIRGIKEAFPSGLIIRSTDETYNIFCRFPSESANNSAIFINDGDAVVVKGIFSKKGHPYGILYDTEFISPSELNIEYKESDIGEILSSITNKNISVNSVIHGKITDILSLDDFKQQAIDYIDFDSAYFSDNIARIDGTSGGTIYFSYDENSVGSLAVGDRIAIQGELHSMIGFDSADGSYTAVAGYINELYGYYNFDSET